MDTNEPKPKKKPAYGWMPCDHCDGQSGKPWCVICRGKGGRLVAVDPDRAMNSLPAKGD